MKTLTLTLIILAFTIQLKAEQPPANYQQFKVAFFDYEHHNTNTPEIAGIKLTETNKMIIGASTGAMAFGVAEYYLLTDNRKGYHKSIFIGGLVHLSVQMFLMFYK